MIGWWATVLILSQDPVTFEHRLEIGARSFVRIDSSLTLEVVTTDGEGEKKRLLTMDSREEFEQHVSGAKQLDVKCSVGTRRKTWEGRAPEESVTLLQGHGYLVSLEIPLRVTTDTGQEVPPEADAIGAWLSLGRLLPAQPKKLGESWSLTAKDLGAALWTGFEEPTGEIRVLFAAFDQRRATLSLSGQLRGKTKEGYEGMLELGETTLAFDTAAGKPVSFLLTGSLALSRKIVERRPKPGSLTEEIEVLQGNVRMKSTRFVVSIKFE